MDFAGASTFLLLTAPLLFLIAVLIKLDSRGPIIYAQERVGRNRRRAQRRADVIPVRAELRQSDRRQNGGEGTSFLMYKFRTMHPDAENGGPQWAAKHHPRVTRAGRCLRKLRLDELPQLWNVLRGDMGLVGPRRNAHRPESPASLKLSTATIRTSTTSGRSSTTTSLT